MSDNDYVAELAVWIIRQIANALLVAAGVVAITGILVLATDGADGLVVVLGSVAALLGAVVAIYDAKPPRLPAQRSLPAAD
jgi:hypothetical protein